MLSSVMVAVLIPEDVVLQLDVHERLGGDVSGCSVLATRPELQKRWSRSLRQSGLRTRRASVIA